MVVVIKFKTRNRWGRKKTIIISKLLYADREIKLRHNKTRRILLLKMRGIFVKIKV